MSTSVPFAVSSKCVVRLTSDPTDVIVENTPSNDDDNDSTSELSKLPVGHHQHWSSSKSGGSLCSMLPDGRAESGWIARQGDDQFEFLDLHENSSGITMSVQSFLDKYAQSSEMTQNYGDPMSVKLMSQGVGLPPSASRRSMFSLHNLPHPSQLRKKAGAQKRKRCEMDKDLPVDKHIQQLKKKKVAYFSTEAATQKKPSPQSEATTSTSQQTFTPVQNPSSVSPTPLPTRIAALTATAERSPPVQATEAVSADPVPPAVAMPVSVMGTTGEDEEDEHWFKPYWKSQQPTYQKTFEE